MTKENWERKLFCLLTPALMGDTCWPLAVRTARHAWNIVFIGSITCSSQILPRRSREAEKESLPHNPIILRGQRSKAHPWQEATAVLRRPSRVTRRVHPHPRTRPRPRRRNPDPGAHAQRPRQPGLRPDPAGDCANVANRPASDANTAALTPRPRKPRVFRRKGWLGGSSFREFSCSSQGASLAYRAR